MSIQGIKVSDELEKLFVEMRTTDPSAGLVQVRLASDCYQKVFDIGGSASYDSVIDRIANDEDKDPSYFFLRQAPNKYLIILYIDENAPVKQKMTYASSLRSLKEAFGTDMITDEVQCHEPAEVSALDKTKKGAPPETSREDLLSADEKAKEMAANEEEIARKEQIAQLAERKAAFEVDSTTNELASVSLKKTGISTSSPQTLTKSKSVPMGIGGFNQAVKLEAKHIEELKKFRDGEVNWVAFAYEKTLSLETANATLGKLEDVVDMKQPRFYLFKYKSSNVFFYCCPDDSPFHNRMIYSTSKPGLVNAIMAEDISIDLRMEVTGFTEMTEKSIEAELQGEGRRARDHTGPVRSKSVEMLNGGGAHPLYGKTGASNGHPVYGKPSASSKPNQGGDLYAASTISVGGGKKKIVLPPKVAYG